MIHLLRQNLLHILRTRLLFMILVFSFLIQFVGIQTLHSATLYFQGVLSSIGQKQSLFLALFFQLFTGAFLSAVFGIWMIPYAHQGQRSSLTFTLPVSKWEFAFTYALSMLLLLLAQHLVLLASYGSVFGFSVFFSKDFPWGPLLSCLFLETLAFEVFAFAFAISAMTFGQIATFFIGAGVFFLLQLGGAILKLDLSHFFVETPTALVWARYIYEALPPLGELVFDLRQGFAEPALFNRHLFLWAIWLVLFMGLFRLKLRYPAQYRNSEG